MIEQTWTELFQEFGIVSSILFILWIRIKVELKKERKRNG